MGVGGGGVVCFCGGVVEFFLLLFPCGDGVEVLCGFYGDAVLFFYAEVGVEAGVGDACGVQQVGEGFACSGEVGCAVF